MKIYIVSDAHIKNNKEKTYFLFCDFLEKLILKKPDCLVLLGDIFDFLYFDSREVYYFKFYEALKRLNSCGTKIYYLFGNHDFNFKFKEYPFIKVEPKLMDFKIGEYNSYIYHGDGIDTSDYKYRFLKKILRSKLFYYIYTITPKKAIYYISEKVSSLSRNASKKIFYSKESRKSTYEKEALNLFNKNKEIDLIIFAHTHKAVLRSFEIASKKKYYVNTGSFKYDSSYVSIIDGFLKVEKID